jgi:hypothetical protein
MNKKILFLLIWNGMAHSCSYVQAVKYNDDEIACKKRLAMLIVDKINNVMSVFEEDVDRAIFAASKANKVYRRAGVEPAYGNSTLCTNLIDEQKSIYKVFENSQQIQRQACEYSQMLQYVTSGEQIVLAIEYFYHVLHTIEESREKAFCRVEAIEKCAQKVAKEIGVFEA